MRSIKKFKKSKKVSRKIKSKKSMKKSMKKQKGKGNDECKKHEDCTQKDNYCYIDTDKNRCYHIDEILYKSIMINDINFVNYILHYNGANPNIQYDAGLTPLMITNDENMAKLLLIYHANPYIENNNDETVLYYNQNEKIIKLLLDNGADPNKPNKNGKTPLMFAVEDRSIEHIKLLLNKMNKKSINLKSNFGKTALFDVKRPDIMELLLNYEADPNIQDNEGNTVLMNICSSYEKKINYDLIKLLLDYDANPTIKNKEGKSVYDIKNDRIQNILIEYKKIKKEQTKSSTNLPPELLGLIDSYSNLNNPNEKKFKYN